MNLDDALRSLPLFALHPDEQKAVYARVIAIRKSQPDLNESEAARIAARELLEEAIAERDEIKSIALDQWLEIKNPWRPTTAMAAAARRALEWRREFGRGGTAVGIARARDIVNRRRLPRDTIMRMVSFFARHEIDKRATGFREGEEGFPSNGRIAWDLWGGDAGQRWSRRIRDRIEELGE